MMRSILSTFWDLVLLDIARHARFRLPVFVLLVASPLTLAPCVAGDYLSQEEVKALVSGNTAEMLLPGTRKTEMAIGAHRSIKFNSSGSFEQHTDRSDAAGGAFSDRGKWWVKGNGMLCFKVEDKNRPVCRFVKRGSGKKYELYNKKGQKKGTWNRVVPGT